MRTPLWQGGRAGLSLTGQQQLSTQGLEGHPSRGMAGVQSHRVLP